MSDAHPEISLADVAWLTALARSLTRDEADADDLVQDTWIAARTSPPEHGRVNRPWLATVLRRFHLQSLRSGRRRVHRARAAARDEALPDTAELVGRAELQRTLADCLLSVDEPYRTTLMLVTFEGVHAAQIAEREGVSASVVRYRVRKAREMLRTKLMATNGEDWSQWRAALLPLASIPLPGELAAVPAAAAAAHVAPKSAWIGAIAMNVKLLVALATLVAALSALFLVRPESMDALSGLERGVRLTADDPEPPRLEGLFGGAVRVVESDAPEVDAAARDEAAAEDPIDEPAASEPAPDLATLEMRIRSPRGGWSAAIEADEPVFEEAGRPSWHAATLLNDVPRQITGGRGPGRVCCQSSDRHADGVYTWTNVRTGVPIRVAALDDVFLPVETAAVGPLLPGEHRVVELSVLRAMKTLRVRVLSTNGDPVPDARVTLSQFRDYTVTGGKVEADGSFRREGIGVDRVKLRVAAEGYATWIDESFEVNDLGVDVVLEPGRTVRVELRSPTFEPVSGARVTCKLPGSDRNLRFTNPVRSSAEGVCVLPSIPLAELPLELEVDGWTLTETLPKGERTHTIEIPARSELRVFVLGEAPTDAAGRDRLRIRPVASLAGGTRFFDAPSAPGKPVSMALFTGSYEVELVREAAGGVIVWASATAAVSVGGAASSEVTLEF